MVIRVSAAVVTLKLEDDVMSPVQFKLPWSVNVTELPDEKSPISITNRAATLIGAPERHSVPVKVPWNVMTVIETSLPPHPDRAAASAAINTNFCPRARGFRGGYSSFITNSGERVDGTPCEKDSVARAYQWMSPVAIAFPRLSGL